MRRLVVAVAALAIVVAVVPATPPVSADVDATPVRISGADRFATAAALAALAHPGGADSAVIARGDDPADALAGAGLAGALDAPVLLVTPDDVPEATAAALDRLGVTEVVVLGGAAAISAEVENALAVGGRDVTRIGGPHRFATAAAVARATAAAGGAPERVIVASGHGGPDALVAGVPAAAAGQPVVLVGQDGAGSDALDVLGELAPAEVVVVGGTAAVPDGVVAELGGVVTSVTRVAGPTRDATAAAVADSLAPGGGRVLVVRGDDLGDALAAAPAAAALDAALLLAPTPSEPGAATLRWLAERRSDGVTAVGGAAAITTGALGAALRAAATGDPTAPGVIRLATTGTGHEAIAELLRDVVADPRWWGRGAIGFEVTGDDPHATLVMATGGDIADAAPACRDDAHCRVGDTVMVNADLWASPPPGWTPESYRTWVLSHLVGRWLGVTPDGCLDGEAAPATGGQTADPAPCVRNAWPTETEQDAVAALHVPTVRVAATGDVHGERHIGTAAQAGVNPLRNLAPVFADADVSIINLETAVGVLGAPEPKTYTFQAPPELLDRVAESGVDVVSLANNHALDYGVTALFETIDNARARGLAVVGAGRDAAEAYAPAIIDVDGVRVGVVGLSRVLSPHWHAGPNRPGIASAYDDGAAVAAVRAAAEAAEVVVVAIHWGAEYTDCPDPHQRRLARLLVDAGADVIAGHHPHVLQGIDTRRDDAVVAMSLGNTVWYHDRPPSNLTGVLVADVTPSTVDARLVPAVIARDGTPGLVDGDAARVILDRVAARRPGGPVCGDW